VTVPDRVRRQRTSSDRLLTRLPALRYAMVARVLLDGRAAGSHVLLDATVVPLGRDYNRPDLGSADQWTRRRWRALPRGDVEEEALGRLS